jgi:hypothetical protein
VEDGRGVRLLGKGVVMDTNGSHSLTTVCFAECLLTGDASIPPEAGAMPGGCRQNRSKPRGRSRVGCGCEAPERKSPAGAFLPLATPADSRHTLASKPVGPLPQGMLSLGGFLFWGGGRP